MPFVSLLKCCRCLFTLMLLCASLAAFADAGRVSAIDKSRAPLPYEVSISTVELVDDRGELRSLRVLYPQATERYPLIVFSHGNWSDNTKYDALVREWVAHGYVVVMPYHLDGGGMMRGIFNSLRYGQLGLISERAKDVHWIIDALPELAEKSPELSARMQMDNIAVTGHSFGAYTAQQMIGAGAFDEDDQSWVYARHERVKAVVAISPPGPMFTTITELSWQSVDKPMLVTTGTEDVNDTFWPDWRSHLLSFDGAKPGHNYSLVVDNADHYLGNLICRPERETPPQHEALGVINDASLAFLDWHLKGKATALWPPKETRRVGQAVYNQR